MLAGYSIQYSSTVIFPESSNVVGVEAVYPHPFYNAANQYINDIGLIKVSSPIEMELFDYKVKLPSQWSFFSTGTETVLAGWGLNAVRMLFLNFKNLLNFKIHFRLMVYHRQFFKKLNYKSIQRLIVIKFTIFKFIPQTFVLELKEVIKDNAMMSIL